MENIKSLSDDNLLRRTKQIVEIERRITARLIDHLQEVDLRGLHLARGFGSIYDYLIRGLGYSGGSAHRRIQAMEICQALPEVTAKIESGQVNLTQAMQLQGHFEREEKLTGQKVTPEVKRDLLAQVQGMSTRDIDKTLAALRPETPKPDKTRELSNDLTQITFTSDQELVDLLERIKHLTAHQNSNPNFLELFKFMAKKTLAQIDPIEKAKRARKKPSQISSQMPTQTHIRTQTPAPGRKIRRTRPIPAATLHALQLRDRGECQFVDPQTQRRCASKHAIQAEHKIPWAQGGTHELTNLELLCRSHNTWRAIQAYGIEKMRPHLKRKNP